MGGIVSAFTNTVHQAWIAVMQFASAASIGDADELEPPPEDCFYVENNYIFTPLCSSTPTAPRPAHRPWQRESGPQGAGLAASAQQCRPRGQGQREHGEGVREAHRSVRHCVGSSQEINSTGWLTATAPSCGSGGVPPYPSPGSIVVSQQPGNRCEAVCGVFLSERHIVNHISNEVPAGFPPSLRG